MASGYGEKLLMASVYLTAVLMTTMHGPADESHYPERSTGQALHEQSGAYNMKSRQSSTSKGSVMISGIGSAIVGSSSMSAQLIPVTGAVQKLLALVMV